MAVAAHPVEDHPGDGHRRVEGGEAVDHGRHRCAHRRRVDHQHDRGAKQGGDLRSAGHRPHRVARAVEESHHPLDH